jgi:hypothetical protein
LKETTTMQTKRRFPPPEAAILQRRTNDERIQETTKQNIEFEYTKYKASWEHQTDSKIKFKNISERFQKLQLEHNLVLDARRKK